MLNLVTRRIVATVVTLFLISIVAFILIQLPPGDFVDAYAGKKTQGGVIITQEELDVMRTRLGLDQPFFHQYVRWIGGVVRGDLGFSWEFHRPVADVIAERLPLTLALAFCTVGDHAATVVGYIGLATPNFLFALILMYLGHKWFGMSVGGLFSPEFEDAAWTWARFGDMLMHLWIPVIVLGTAGTAFQMRTMRATLLDELNKMYVTAARAGGVPEFRMLMKYPVRMALNPIVATLGWELTNIISGAPIVGIVLSLPDTGPLFINALLNQDMYLAGAMILIYCILVIIGTFISDILLMVLDPRIRLEGRS
jgi:peptide/nickel transport system permease protein